MCFRGGGGATFAQHPALCAVHGGVPTCHCATVLRIKHGRRSRVNGSWGGARASLGHCMSHTCTCSAGMGVGVCGPVPGQTSKQKAARQTRIRATTLACPPLCG